MKSIPLNVLTLYADLLQKVQTAPASGSVYVQTIKGHPYAYMRRQVGETRVDTMLGRADAATTQARMRELQRENEARKERRKIVSTLRHLVPGPTHDLGKVLHAVADAGLFARGAILVGTAAYQCYAPVVGFALPSSALITQDADLATASLALSAHDDGDDRQGDDDRDGRAATKLSMETILRRADRTFVSLPGLDRRAPPSRYRSASGFLVDLLTPRLRRTDPDPVPLPALAAAATPLQQLDWLIAEPIDALALHEAGIRVRIPTPARYAIHKLILAQKRPAGDMAKRQKDLVQARSLIEALGSTAPFDLADALSDARQRGRDGWRKPIDRSLAEIGAMHLIDA